MLEQTDRLNRFLAEINKEAEEKRGAIIAELREHQEKELVQARNDAQRLREETVASEEKRLVIAQNAALSQERERLRRALSAKREEIANAMLDSARRKLAEFARAPAYDEFLAEQIRKLAERFSGKAFTLFVRLGDLAKARELLCERDGCSAEADPGIALGGCRLECGRITVDDTLDARLEQSRGSVLAEISLPEL